MSLSLDRIEIEAVGSDPVRLATALLGQLPDFDGPVPIEMIARALDIVEIHAVPLEALEACLQCDAAKSYGQIIVNADRPRRRQRYSIGHELGHFLNERHRSVNGTGFVCTAEDMQTALRKGVHQRQEMEANRFAIEVLTPRRRLAPLLRRAADLEHAMTIAETFENSREAAVRRYVELQGECLAVVFTRDGRVRYIEKSEAFPPTLPWIGDAIPGGEAGTPGTMTSMDKADAERWLRRADGISLYEQTVLQRDGYAITLLLAETNDD